METARGHTCVYVSSGSGVHDRRWMTALHSLGHQPTHVARDQYSSDSEFRNAVRDVVDSNTPVIAGPLELASSIDLVSGQLVLLSWGFDLQEASADLDLSAFSAVIVDSLANQRIAHKARAKQILNIPWGIDIQSIDADASIADLSEYGVNPDERVVLSLRAHEPRYRIQDIIEAFDQQRHDARLVIGNSGSMTQELQQLAKQRGIDAVFVSTVDELHVPALLRRASAYVTASEVDGTSVTLLQAMACKVPVVASENAGNVDWIVDGETGFLFPTGNMEKLATQIGRALSGDPFMVRAARARVDKTANWQSNVKKLRPLLSSVTQPNGNESSAR